MYETTFLVHKGHLTSRAPWGTRGRANTLELLEHLYPSLQILFAVCVIHLHVEHTSNYKGGISRYFNPVTPVRGLIFYPQLCSR